MTQVQNTGKNHGRGILKYFWEYTHTIIINLEMLDFFNILLRYQRIREVPQK